MLGHRTPTKGALHFPLIIPKKGYNQEIVLGELANYGSPDLRLGLSGA